MILMWLTYEFVTYSDPLIQLIRVDQDTVDQAEDGGLVVSGIRTAQLLDQKAEPVPRLLLIL